ncbi:MAG TPA: aminotransferase class I/II-fold pyridoxal phosphate-dependent enzyme [Rhizomicrobium sp.]
MNCGGRFGVFVSALENCVSRRRRPRRRGGSSSFPSRLSETALHVHRWRAGDLIAPPRPLGCIGDLERHLEAVSNKCTRAIVVTDGVFSMRGDHAPLDRIMMLARAYDGAFAENVIVAVDDSHGVGAFGKTGRGTEEYTGSGPADLLVATLGKALGVNGGYVVAEETVIRYLRETSPFYIYSNPITPAEAAAAHKAIDILDSPPGMSLLAHLRAMTARFRAGLAKLRLETLPGEHPVVPLMLRDAARTSALIAHLRREGILATGLNYPVVPKGDEEIRFQITADHTAADVDSALRALARFAE